VNHPPRSPQRPANTSAGARARDGIMLDRLSTKPPRFGGKLTLIWLIRCASSSSDAVGPIDRCNHS